MIELDAKTMILMVLLGISVATNIVAVWMLRHNIPILYEKCEELLEKFHALDKGAEATLFVPGDVPLIEKSDVKKVLRLGERHGLVICPAKDGGTGMLYRRPPTIINTRFTTKSFYEHAKEAESKNVKVHIHYSAHFSLDIDTREDIADFLYLPAGGKRYVKGTKTWEFLNKKF